MKRFALILTVLLFISIAYTRSTEDKINNLIKWYHENSEHELKFALKQVENEGIGAIAIDDIEKDEQLFMVPRKMFLSSVDARNEFSHVKTPGVLNYEALALKLIQEKYNTTSFWKPFIDILPKEFNELPILWDESDFRFTKGTAMRSFATAVRNNIENSFQQLNEIIGNRTDVFEDPTIFTFENYLWAMNVIHTRSWNINIGEEAALCLIPIADMLNHREDSSAIYLNETIFSLNASQSFAKGEQVHITYGQKSNFELLGTYGFILDNNKHNNVNLYFTFNSDSGAVSSALKTKLKETNQSFDQLNLYINAFPIELVKVFRLSSMMFSDFVHFDSIIAGNAISLRNEARALRSTLTALKNLLNDFGTEEENDALYKEATLPHHHLALQMREGERYIIRNCIAEVEAAWLDIFVSGQLRGEIEIGE